MNNLRSKKAQQQLARLARQQANNQQQNNSQQLKQKQLEREEKIRQEMLLADKIKRNFNNN
jgi:hypothetical protein